MSRITEREFLTIASLVYGKLTQNYNDLTDQALVYSILMLRDTQYDSFWSMYSEYAGLPIQTLQSLFQALSHNIFFATTRWSTCVQEANLLQTSLINLTASDNNFKFRKSVNRKQSPALVQYRQQFTSWLKSVLKITRDLNFDEMDDKEICQFINTKIKLNEKTLFWKQVVELSDGKTSKQIQDYYHHTYQNVMFDKQLSISDKQTLRQLSAFWKDEKPTYVSGKFLEMSPGNTYFKHNITMYVINLRRAKE
ncbi:Hypothetical_protein [Hexamita inflata]|uniref:Hypothetical_protein n=1 Tax=Hexamita inflata TaxID=28002 RepID=A0AA86NFW1_9EUKA|nr:Hypothetical protein HINF_LOCUS6792 [Hexamita inflata]